MKDNCSNISTGETTRQINFNAPHVVFFDAKGEIAFCEKSLNLHFCKSNVFTYPNFQDATDAVSRYKSIKQGMGN